MAVNKPSPINIKLGEKFKDIETSVINTFFTTLEQLRQYHVQGGKKGNGFSETPAAFNTTVAVDNNIIDTTYPEKIKEYITVLEQSRYIANTYHDQIQIPVSNETLIKATEYVNDYVTVINQLIALDTNDGAYNGSHHGSDNPCPGYCPYWTAPCGSDNSVCSCYGACTGMGKPWNCCSGMS